MNWTEGTLNRHSRTRKGKGALLRQREHFARARSGMLNANVHISPPSTSFRGHPVRCSPPTRHESMTPASSRKRLRAGALELGKYISGPDLQQLPQPATFRREQNVEETLCQKRQKLLLKGDWVGTDLQKPIEMEFAKPRRLPHNPWRGTRSRHQSSRQRLRQLAGLKTLGNASTVSTPISHRKITIRVGSRERVLGGAQYQPNKHGHRRIRGNCDSSSTACSDTCSDQRCGDCSQLHILASSPLLFQPVPTRPALLHLLPSSTPFDSDNADSIRAQVGIQLPQVTPSQIEDNRAWRFFAADSASQGSGISSNRGFAAEAAVSPGISQCGALGQICNSPQGFSSCTITSTVIEEDSELDKSPPSCVEGLLRPEGSEIAASKRLPSDRSQTALYLNKINRPDCRLSPLRAVSVYKSENTHACRERRAGSSENFDGVSWLAFQRSQSLSSSTPVASHTTISQDEQDDGSPVETGLVRPQSSGHKNDWASSQAQDMQCLMEGRRLRAGSPEDDNDVWKKFVFGGSDSELLEEALTDARKQTARALQPSLSSTDVHQEDSEIDIRSSQEAQQLDGPVHHPQPRTSISNTAVASHTATAGSSSPELVSDPVSKLCVTAAQASPGPCLSPPQSACLAELAGLGGISTSTTSDAVTTSPVHYSNPNQRQTVADEGFIFARPKLFRGKKTGPVSEQLHIALSAPQIRGWNWRRGRQKRANDGRARIRRLPNYGSDPIEEFDDEARSDRAQKGSIFGSLETDGCR